MITHAPSDLSQHLVFCPPEQKCELRDVIFTLAVVESDFRFVMIVSTVCTLPIFDDFVSSTL
jgi:hypothetical protein